MLHEGASVRLWQRRVRGYRFLKVRFDRQSGESRCDAQGKSKKTPLATTPKRIQQLANRVDTSVGQEDGLGANSLNY